MHCYSCVAELHVLSVLYLELAELPESQKETAAGLRSFVAVRPALLRQAERQLDMQRWGYQPLIGHEDVLQPTGNEETSKEEGALGTGRSADIRSMPSLDIRK